MNELVIIDVSSLVHVGNSSKFFGGRMFYNYPVGGIHYLMRYVSIAFASMNDVVLCFDSPSFRNELQKNYKSGRLWKPQVISQLETVFESFSACGIRCEKYDKFEADDIVDWAVQQNSRNYGNTTILGNDYDLCHSIQSGVQFQAIREGMNCVLPSNFETAFDSKHRVRFNTISAYKVFCGCKSDKIPALHLQSGLNGFELYCKFLEYLDSKGITQIKHLAWWKLPMYFACNTEYFTEEEQEEVLTRVKLIYPAECPADLCITPVRYSGVQKDKLTRFLTLYGDKDSLRCLELKSSASSDEEKESIRGKARSLVSGEFAVDKNLEFAAKTRSTTIPLDSFTRDY